jgi:cell division protein FtsW (lipid II flippase)
MAKAEKNKEKPDKKPDKKGDKKPSKPAGGASSCGLNLPLFFVLLAVAMGYASVLAVKLCNAPVLTTAHLEPLIFFAASLLMTRLALGITGYRGDPAIVAGAFLLAGIGAVIQLRVGAFTGGRMEMMPFAIGAALFVVITILLGKKRIGMLEHLGWPAYVIALAVLAAILVFGQKFRGAVFLPGNYNPSEAAKPLLILFFAAFLAKHKKEFENTFLGIPLPSFQSLFLLVVFWSLPIILTLMIGDLGQALLLNAVLVVMLYAVGKKFGWLLLGMVTLAGLAILAGNLSQHAQARFAIWENPFSDPVGKGWQVLQSLSAMYSGGMWGCGLGAGAPSAVPIVSSDFIYAALGEETGWAGCALLLLAYGIFCVRSWRAAANAATPFAITFGAGLAACVAAQTLINVAGVTKALPLTGITLPFISHGGSSLVTSFCIAGLLAALSDNGK